MMKRSEFLALICAPLLAPFVKADKPPVRIPPEQIPKVFLDRVSQPEFRPLNDHLYYFGGGRGGGKTRFQKSRNSVRHNALLGHYNGLAERKKKAKNYHAK